MVPPGFRRPPWQTCGRPRHTQGIPWAYPGPWAHPGHTHQRGHDAQAMLLAPCSDIQCKTRRAVPVL